jgi:hypothetical protein
VLAGVAANHTRNMANQNFFDHIDRDGRTPGDRAELAGYSYQQIGENIAAGSDTARKVVDGWLASPGHCATLMNPDFRDLGAAYAMDPKSDAGIYWTGLFGAPQRLTASPPCRLGQSRPTAEPQRAPEHRGERAGAVVALVQRHLQHRMPGRQRIQPGQQAHARSHCTRLRPVSR